MKINRSISVIICLLLSMSLTSCGQEYTFHLDWADGFFSFNDEDEVPEFGNSPSVALEQEEYLPGDQLYDEDHPDYYKHGGAYMTAEIEKGLKDLWDNHLALSIMIEKLDFPEEAKNFENLIWINPQTGRKELGYEADKVDMFFLTYNNPVENQEERPIYQKLTPEEIEQFLDFENKYYELGKQYNNRNSAQYHKHAITGEELYESFLEYQKEQEQKRKENEGKKQ